MTKTFEWKIAELELKKSGLDSSFLELKKKEYEQRISELLANPMQEWDEEKAIDKFNEVRECYSKIEVINYEIQHIPETIKEIEKKISHYQKMREKVRNIPLYRDTEEWIAEILWWDPVYQYAKETNKELLAKKIEERRLNINEYETHLGNMYKELLKTYEKKEKEVKQNMPKKVEILLPEWMSEQIKEDLKDDKLLNPQEIEKFLKNELKKNAWDIMISHIKNTFKENYNQAYNYISKLIKKYPKFKIIDNVEKKGTTLSKTKREKLISSISQEETEEHKNERLKKSSLLSKLNEIWKIEDLKSRISKYLDLFEELNHTFADREEFELHMLEVITKQTNMKMEKEIIKTLNWLIQGNFYTEKTGLYKYNVYKFNRGSRRMLAYPNGKIFTLCSHEKYEEIINTQPPIDKTK